MNMITKFFKSVKANEKSVKLGLFVFLLALLSFGLGFFAGAGIDQPCQIKIQP